MSTAFALRTFTPAEMGQISGLAPNMQRDWRRRGFIRSATGHARFSAFEVADVRVLKLLSDGGAGPASSRLWKRAVAYCVVSAALRSEGAFSRPISKIERDSIREDILAEVTREEPVYTGTHLPANAQRMIKAAPRFAIWWGDTGGSVGDSLDNLQAARAQSHDIALPAFHLDIHRAAADLLQLAGHLVDVKS